jgi:DNA repair protein RadC
MSDKLNINQWAEEDRPREKMARLGPQALTDAELLAILVGSGSPKEDAVSLMKRILSDCNNNLNTLGKKSIDDL